MAQGQKILVIDDDPDIREALTIILASQGYQVSTAKYGVEGLEKLKADTPDLIILDLIMPGMGGPAVYKMLKDPSHPEWHDIRILILTSLREASSRARFEEETGMEMKVEAYVEKPVSPPMMLEKVKGLLHNGKRIRT